jgi:hypothetical protein
MEIRTILREILRQTDWDQSELATRLKVSQPTISRWMDDKKPQEPKIKQRDRIVALAEKHGIVNGHNKGAYRTISIVGYVGAGGQVAYGEGQGPFGEAPMPPKDATARTVAVVIRGDSMAPLADGWTVYYDDRRDPPTEDLFGKLCVVGLQDGRVLIKTLVQGRKPGHFDLYSNNAPPLLDQAVDWAARVSWIAPL